MVSISISIVLLKVAFLSVGWYTPSLVQTVILFQVVCFLDIQKVSLAPSRFGHQVFVRNEIYFLPGSVNIIHVLHLHQHRLGLFELLLVHILTLLSRKIDCSEGQSSKLIWESSCKLLLHLFKIYETVSGVASRVLSDIVGWHRASILLRGSFSLFHRLTRHELGAAISAGCGRLNVLRHILLRIKFVLLDVLHVLSQAVQDLWSIVWVKDALCLSLDVACAGTVSMVLLLSSLLWLLFRTDTTNTRGTVPRAEDRLVSCYVNVISQVLCLHLAFLMLKREHIRAKTLLIGVHMTDRVIVVMFW
jgi:hypothetical protein